MEIEFAVSGDVLVYIPESAIVGRIEHEGAIVAPAVTPVRVAASLRASSCKDCSCSLHSS